MDEDVSRAALGYLLIVVVGVFTFLLALFFLPLVDDMERIIELLEARATEFPGSRCAQPE